MTVATRFEIDVEFCTGVVVVRFCKEALLDQAGAQRFRDEFDRLLVEQGEADYLIDFTGVQDLGDKYLSALLYFSRSALANVDATLSLCGLSLHILEIFQDAKLAAEFTIYANQDAALADLAQL